MNLNQVNLIGRVGGDPEVKQLPSGRLVCSFSIATNRTWTQDGQKKEQTEWHYIVFFGDNLIEKVIQPYVQRGSEVYVCGRLQTRSWEKDGQKHYRTEIVGEQIQLGARPSNEPRRIPKSKEEEDAMSADEAFDTVLGTEEPPADSPTARRRAATGGSRAPAKKTGGDDDIRPEDIPF